MVGLDQRTRRPASASHEIERQPLAHLGNEGIHVERKDAMLVDEPILVHHAVQHVQAVLDRQLAQRIRHVYGFDSTRQVAEPMVAVLKGLRTSRVKGPSRQPF